MRAAVIVAAGLALAACAGSPTEKRWGCSLAKGAFKSCASIAEIDARSRPQPLEPAGGVTLRKLTGSRPADLAGTPGEDGAAPAREADTVLRITLAPWIDAAGDYHARSEIYAVVRRGGWTVPVPPPPPPPVEAAP